MLSWIIGLIPGLFGTVNNITNAIANAKIAAINAKTEEERIQANENVTTLQMRRDVLMAEAGSFMNRFIRGLLALGPTVYLGKIYIWDKVIGSYMGCGMTSPTHTFPICQSFNTDPLSDQLWYVVTATIAFYFLYEGAKVLRR